MHLQPDIALVIDGLIRLPLASRVVVFGSVARHADNPNDVDVALDVTGMDLLDQEAKKQYTRTINGMLQLARQHYGYLDPFVIGNGRLLVRNAEASNYEWARNAKAIRAAIAAEGVPLSVVMERIAQEIVEDDSQTSGPKG